MHVDNLIFIHFSQAAAVQQGQATKANTRKCKQQRKKSGAKPDASQNELYPTLARLLSDARLSTQQRLTLNET